MSAQPLRHYYAPRDGRNGNACAHGTAAGHACALPESDPVHLEPGDGDAFTDAIRAASPHPHAQHTPEQDERAVARARKRNAARSRASGADAGG
jgi:hypothetical protein